MYLSRYIATMYLSNHHYRREPDRFDSCLDACIIGPGCKSSSEGQVPRDAVDQAKSRVGAFDAESGLSDRLPTRSTRCGGMQAVFVGGRVWRREILSICMAEKSTCCMLLCVQKRRGGTFFRAVRKVPGLFPTQLIQPAILYTRRQKKKENSQHHPSS